MSQQKTESVKKAMSKMREYSDGEDKMLGMMIYRIDDKSLEDIFSQNNINTLEEAIERIEKMEGEYMYVNDFPIKEAGKALRKSEVLSTLQELKGEK